MPTKMTRFGQLIVENKWERGTALSEVEPLEILCTISVCLIRHSTRCDLSICSFTLVGSRLSTEEHSQEWLCRSGHRVPLRRLRKDFEAVGDFGGFAEHGGYGAVFVLAEFDGVPDGLFFQLAGQAVDHFDFGPDLRRIFGAFAGDFDFERGEFLAFFFEDQDDVYGGAGA
jgi:hypothetical protein